MTILNKNIKSYKSNSAKATIGVGKKIGANLKKGDVVALYGNLGAGKTHLVKGIAEAFNFTGIVNSPTFTLINEYEADVPVYHFDLYRLTKPQHILGIGIDEYFSGEGICVVEWADKAEGMLPDDIIPIYIEIVSEKQRIIKMRCAE